MHNTQIIRRVDDLGRVVIPKEIRNALEIREGDPLEVFVENGANKIVAFRKADCGIIEQFRAVRDRMLDRVCEEGNYPDDYCVALSVMFDAIETLFNNTKKEDDN